MELPSSLKEAQHLSAHRVNKLSVIWSPMSGPAGTQISQSLFNMMVSLMHCLLLCDPSNSFRI